MTNEPEAIDIDESPTAFVTATSHLYRAEMNRMLVWRQRLDITTNWAIILATALTTFTLGSKEVPHYILLLGLSLIFISILLEGRRYRHLHHSKWRLYLLESGFFSEVIDPASVSQAAPDWRQLLAADLRHTHFSLSWLTAMRLRLRRNYLLVIAFITAVWVAKLFIHPQRPESFAAFFSRIGVGSFLPPWFVAMTAVLFIGAAIVLGLSCPPAEELEDWSIQYHRSRRSDQDPRS